MHFGHTPYDSLPFYIQPTFWNLWGYGAWVRRIRGFPMPGGKYFGGGIPIEAMGVSQSSAEIQSVVENKVRQNAAQLEKAPYGYRPPVGYQLARLVGPVPGPSYGMSMNAFTDATPITPASIERFEKRFERRAPGFSKIGEIEKPEDIIAYDGDESYSTTNGVHTALPHIEAS